MYIYICMIVVRCLSMTDRPVTSNSRFEMVRGSEVSRISRSWNLERSSFHLIEDLRKGLPKNTPKVVLVRKTRNIYGCFSGCGLIGYIWVAQQAWTAWSSWIGSSLKTVAWLRKPLWSQTGPCHSEAILCEFTGGYGITMVYGLWMFLRDLSIYIYG
jgi:hypothetical protein